jgi:hypothetical protein
MPWLPIGNSLSVGIWKGLVSKPKMRTRLASLSFSEKIKILEKLRDRSQAIAASGLRRTLAREGGKKPVKRGK